MVDRINHIFLTLFRFFSNNRNEFFIVLFLSLLNASYLLFYKYFPFLDSPQHLYNTNVIGELVKGNDFFKQYFEINNVLVGYWVAHAILSFMNYFLPAWLANKIFLMIYLVVTPLTFRYLVKSINPNARYMCLLVLPFLHNSFYFMGYYPFLIAWPVAFILIGYILRKYNHIGVKEFFSLTILIFLLYLSHMVVFAFSLAVIFGWFIFDLFWNYFHEKKNKKYVFITGLKKGLKVLLAALPALIFAAIYVFQVFDLNTSSKLSEATYLSFSELWKMFSNFVVLGYFIDEKGGVWISVILWLIAFVTAFTIIKYMSSFTRLFMKTWFIILLQS
jgi:hypothetical protein